MFEIGNSTALIPCMTGHQCVECSDPTEVYGFGRLSAVVDYYLCKRCGHVWAVHKNDPTIIDHFKPVKRTNLNV
jgi:hypothetical protein